MLKIASPVIRTPVGSCSSDTCPGVCPGVCTTRRPPADVEHLAVDSSVDDGEGLRTWPSARDS